MKILHVVPGIEQISGGPSQAAVAICNALIKTYVESTIVTTKDQLDRYRLVNHESIKDKIIFFDRWKLEKFAFSKQISKWLSLNIINFDVIHIHSLFNFPSYIAATFARKAGVPYVIRPAGTINTWKQHKMWKKLIWMNYIENQNFKSVAAIHATSKQETEYLSNYFQSNIIHTIPLGVNLPLATNQNSEKEYKEKLQVLFLSRINPKKNIPTLLLAIKKLVDRNIPISLKIAGKADPGQENYEKRLSKMVEQLDIKSSVNFIGFVEGKNKTREFNSSDLFVLPSYDENFGIAVIEAMAYGLPVIISNRVALSEKVISYNTGFVIGCDDVYGIANSIQNLYENKKLRSKMSENSRLLASKFSWSSTADYLVKLYEKIL